MKRLAVLLAWAVVALLRVPEAVASGLTIDTTEYGPWSDAIEALQRDLTSEGAVVHVVVSDENGRGLPCDEYALTPDAVTDRAFVVEACDPVTRATELRLAHRDALFTSGVPVWRPANAGLAVVQTRHAAAHGGARQDAHGELGCSLAVRPYINDLHDGRRVYLTPDAYVLRVVDTDASVDALDDGWALSTGAVGSLDVAYEIRDRADDHVVVRAHAALVCLRSNGRDAPPDMLHVTPAPPRLPSAEAWVTSAAAHRGNVGHWYAFDCPPGTPGTAWGTGVYTDDSSICTAAVHDGRITARGGGLVYYQIRAGRDSYDGSTRHGASTLAYGTHDGSVVFWSPDTTDALGIGDLSDPTPSDEVTRAGTAEPPRPFVQVHVDIYALHFNTIDLSGTPLGTVRGVETGQRFGVTGASTVGITPYTAPHFGIGVEVPWAVFSVEGAYLPLGWATGGAHGGSASMSFVALSAAARVASGAWSVSAGPSAGLFWAQGDYDRGWSTDPMARGGVTAEIRFRMTGIRGRRNRATEGSLDNFVRFTGDFVGGGGWMIAYGIGAGSRPGQ